MNSGVSAFLSRRGGTAGSFNPDRAANLLTDPTSASNRYYAVDLTATRRKMIGTIFPRHAAKMVEEMKH